MSTETIRLIRDGENGGKGYGGGGRGRLYTYRYTVTTGMTPALRWAAMRLRAILMFHNCEGQSHKTVSTDYNFWRERRAEAVSNRCPSAYQPNALPLGQTGSLTRVSIEPGFSVGRSTNYFPPFWEWRRMRAQPAAKGEKSFTIAKQECISLQP